MIMRFTPSKTSICSSSTIPIPAFTALETLITPHLEQLWDALLEKGMILYGVSSDDAHKLQKWGEKENNPGRGWVMVRSKELTSDALTAAMLKGDFYSSSGVMLSKLVRGKSSIELEVDVQTTEEELESEFLFGRPSKRANSEPPSNSSVRGGDRSINEREPSLLQNQRLLLAREGNPLRKERRRLAARVLRLDPTHLFRWSLDASCPKEACARIMGTELQISSRVSIPTKEIELQAIRSQGAGGQNVNKVSTAVHLFFDIRASSLPEIYKERLLMMKDRRISPAGTVIIKSQQARTQEANREKALARFRELILEAMKVRKSRRATAPTKGSKERRLQAKQSRSKKKSLRRRPSTDE